jgi:hypothetical protein
MAIGDVYELRAVWQIGPVSCTNRFFARETDDCSDDYPAETLALSAVAHFHTAWRGCYGTEAVWASLYARRTWPAPGNPFTRVVGLSGTRLFSVGPPVATITIRFFPHTALAPATNSIRLSGFPSPSDITGVLAEADLGLIETFANLFKFAFNAVPGRTGKWAPCIVVPEKPEGMDTVSVRINPSFGTQRTRIAPPSIRA